MRRGDFAACWAVNDWVHRPPRPGRARRPGPALPSALGLGRHAPFDGRDVLVRCYHGLGDTLQFCRYLAPLRRRVRSLALEAQPELLPLLAGAAGRRTASSPFRPDAPAPPVGVRPRDHGARPRAPAAARPRALPDRARGRSATARATLRTSACAGTRARGWSPERASRRDLLAPLAAIPGVSLFSLQRGPAPHRSGPGAPAIANPGDDSMAIIDTARLIAASTSSSRSTPWSPISPARSESRCGCC